MAVMLLSLSTGTVKASDFFFGLTGYGSNLWFSPITASLYLINNVTHMGGSSMLGYDWVSIKNDDGTSIDVDNGNYFGFKARDLFNNFGGGLQIGYQPTYSIFGAWVTGGYKYRQFGMNLDIPDQLTERYKLNAWYIGVGVRLTPFKGLLEEHNWSPFVDFGTSYNAIFSAKSPFDNNLDQFGKGMSTSVGLGVRLINESYDNDDGINISIAFTFPQYDYFNRDFELSNGYKPYANIKARNYSVFLKIMKEF